MKIAYSLPIWYIKWQRILRAKFFKLSGHGLHRRRPNGCTTCNAFSLNQILILNNKVNINWIIIKLIGIYQFKLILTQ